MALNDFFLSMKWWLLERRFIKNMSIYEKYELDVWQNKFIRKPKKKHILDINF